MTGKAFGQSVRRIIIGGLSYDEAVNPTISLLYRTALTGRTFGYNDADDLADELIAIPRLDQPDL